MKSKGHVLSILSSLGQRGKTCANIAKTTGIAVSTTRDLVEKLIEFKILSEKNREQVRSKKSLAGTIYGINDFFINFYFQCLASKREVIKDNDSTQLFSKLCLQSKKFYFIPEFSGHAFEMLIQSVVNRDAKRDFSEKVFEILQLKEPGYAVGNYLEHGISEIDITISNPSDRGDRLIEAKWVADAKSITKDIIDAMLAKEYTPTKGYSVSNYLAISKCPSSAVIDYCQKNEVGLIGLKDLF
jgi:hypothetical protein